MYEKEVVVEFSFDLVFEVSSDALVVYVILFSEVDENDSSTVYDWLFVSVSVSELDLDLVAVRAFSFEHDTESLTLLSFVELLPNVLVLAFERPIPFATEFEDPLVEPTGLVEPDVSVF